MTVCVRAPQGQAYCLVGAWLPSQQGVWTQSWSLERAWQGCASPALHRPSRSCCGVCVQVLLPSRHVAGASCLKLVLLQGGSHTWGHRPPPEACRRHGRTQLLSPGAAHAHTQAWSGALPHGSHLPHLACCSQESDLPTLLSSLQRSSHLAMPEHPSHCDFQRSVEIGLGGPGEEAGSTRGQEGAARATAA